MTTATRIEYRGISPRGRHTVGVERINDLEQWTRRKYRQGWKRLVVELDGAPVAWIERHPETGRRVWCYDVWCSS